MQVDEGEHNLMTKDELLNKLATLTGGRAAEELIFGSITTGASNDIEQATKLARAMITRYGMSRKFDMVALETVTNQYLSGVLGGNRVPDRRRGYRDRQGGAREGYQDPSGEHGRPAPSGASSARKGNHHRRRVYEHAVKKAKPPQRTA